MTASAHCKALPSIDKLLQTAQLAALRERVGHASVKSAAQQQLQSLRDRILANDAMAIDWIQSSSFLDELAALIETHTESAFTSSMQPVFNLTGTVVHTNLGRARLPDCAVTAMAQAATQAVNVEYDLERGERGDRDSHLEQALCAITGAEAATVVNNNAAAVLLVLNTLAKNQEVLISRGELVEIGGAFRIPDVMESASCILKEVGTTNRTHLKDYKSAIGANTALLMKVHTSNYEIKGFTNVVAEAELSALAKAHNIAFVNDLGSGTLVDLRRYGLPHEPTVMEALAVGTDVVTFSGDKLLGGPQAGIIVGRKNLIQRIKQNPLKRALRVDKITLAALVEVINLYKDPDRLHTRLPLLADLTRPLPEIEELAARVLPVLQQTLAGKAEVAVMNCKSQIGSGALPLDLLESRAIEISVTAAKGATDAALTALASAFRALPKPVIGRMHNSKLLFDLRCLRDESAFLEQLASLRV